MQKTVLKGSLEAGEHKIYFSDQASTIDYLILTNKSSNPITLNTEIEYDGNRVAVCPKDLQLQPANSFTDRGLHLLDREYYIIRIAGGTLDFYISIGNDGNNSEQR